MFLSRFRENSWCALVLVSLLFFCACPEDKPDSSGGTDSGVDSGTDVVGDGTSSDPGIDTVVTDEGLDEGLDQDLSVPPAPVTEPGPYNVGFGEWVVQYTPNGRDDERSLRVVFWYPTNDDTGAAAKYAYFLRRPGVFLDAEIADGGPYPVLVFSHGNGGIAEQNYFFAEFLASHGWIFVSPEHTGNTAFDMSLPTHDLLELRPQDISAVLDTLEDLPAEHTLLDQQTDDLVVSGHSFGGYTTLVLTGATFASELVDAECDGVDSDYCEFWRSDGVRERFEAGFVDARIDLGIPMAPAYWLVDDTGEVGTPTLLFTGALDASTGNAEHGDPIWAGLNGSEDMRVDIETAGHYTFSDACELIPSIVGDDGCGDDFIASDDAHFVINAYSLAFIRSRLWGDASATDLLDDVDNPLHSSAVLSHKE